MKIASPRFQAAILFVPLLLCQASTPAQTKKRPKYVTELTRITKTYVPFDSDAEKRCLAQPIAVKRTYDFRQREIVEEVKIAGAYGPRKKRWFDGVARVFGVKPENDFGPYTETVIVNLNKNYGLDVPIGESERSKLMRFSLSESLSKEGRDADAQWKSWLAANPRAKKVDREKAEFKIRAKGLAAAALPRFDWRTAGLDVGPIGDQGKCNTCWAFAAADAIELSRRLSAMRQKRTYPADAPRPSARQLAACLVKDGSYCDSKNPGVPFSYMVDEGLPLGGTTDYGDAATGASTTWNCDSTARTHALTWDYVSPVPNEVAATADIKQAIVTYGGVVSMVNYDDCLSIYGGGVFNEEQKLDGSHFFLIIGWDDAKGAWLVKGSYGQSWGDKGFGWIKYGANKIGQFAAYVVADPDEEERFLSPAVVK